MYTIVDLYSDKAGEISRFLNDFFGKEQILENDLKWEKRYYNSIEIADIIAAYIDNNNKYKINMWISLDKDTFINVTNYNANEIIKYLYERYPY